MAHIVNPYNLDDDDDAVFSALLSQGLIWVETDDDDVDDDNGREAEFEYLESSSGIKVHTLKEHRKRVNAIVASGDFIISASDDKTLRVWNWKTGEHMQTLRGHRSGVSAVVVSGDFVISASDDKTLRVWNWKTGEHLRTLNGYTQKISGLAIDGDVVASASFGEILVWNWQTGELLQKLTEAHPGVVMLVAIDGDFVLSASPDLLLVHNWKTGENLQMLRLHDDTTNEMVYLGLEKDYIILKNSYSIDVWDWKIGKHLDEADLCDKKNIQIDTKAFVISSYVCVYSRKISKWCVYCIDAAFDKVALVEDYSHIITTDQGGWLYVIRTYPSLKRAIADSINSNSATTPPKTAKPKRQKKSSNSRDIQDKHEIVTEPSPDYTTDDVLQAARVFIHRRNEGWVNFSRVSQHLYETFPKLTPKRLGHPSKKYSSLLRFLADYPSNFELRQDPEKQGLYWIRLKP